MNTPRAAIALYVALAVHALVLLVLALRPPSQDSQGPGIGLTLAGDGDGELVVETNPPTNDEPQADRVVSPHTDAVAPETTLYGAGPAQALTPHGVGSSTDRRRDVVQGTGMEGRVGGGSRGARDRWLQALRRHLAAHRRALPLDAGRTQAQVAFRVDADGRVSDLRLQQGSGLDALDAEALDLVRRASPLPAPPSGHTESLVVPVSIGF